MSLLRRNDIENGNNLKLLSVKFERFSKTGIVKSALIFHKIYFKSNIYKLKLKLFLDF